jgi:hypothetical protein
MLRKICGRTKGYASTSFLFFIFGTGWSRSIGHVPYDKNVKCPIKMILPFKFVVIEFKLMDHAEY